LYPKLSIFLKYILHLALILLNLALNKYQNTDKMLESKTISVLVVDDSALNRLVIVEYLKGKEIKILEAEDGEQALQIIELEKPDIILLDLIMPVMDGFEVLEILKKQENKIPIIVITAYLKGNTFQRCKELGAKGFLNKPIKMQELFNLISQVLEQTSSTK
jgi:CheY-like chemotaxis protein